MVVPPPDPARPGVPRLLVSVRDAAEAAAAIAGGCELLDLKEPAAGPLGMADPDAIAAVCAMAADASGNPLLVSVALGEVADWPASRTVPPLPAGVSLAKIGLSDADAGWVVRWLGVRRQFDMARMRAGGRPLAWAAVIYADGPGPSPADVIEAAAATRCTALLIDTAGKTGGGLLDHAPAETLLRWKADAAKAGLTFALAGALRAADLPALAAVRPDVVAIRGAACDGDRTAPVTESAVRAFHNALHAAFG